LFGGGSVSGGFADGLINTGGGQSILGPSSTLIPQGTGIDVQAGIFNVISDNFRARIQMLENDNRVTTLATPNLLVSDNEASKLFAGQEVTVLQKAERTLTYTNSSSGAQNPNLSWNIDAPRRKIGISLVITPKIHADRTVTIRLLQERSSLGDMRENVYSGGEESEDDTTETEDEDDTTSEAKYFLSQDIDMQSIATTVVGKDNNILVIGGLIEETADKEVQKVPFLSEIPIIGDLVFTRYEQVRKRSEILVIIRPYVLLAPGEGEQVSRTFMQKISLHPSARGDIPALGLVSKEDVAKASQINPEDPWYKRVLRYLNVWEIDMDTAPEVENALKDYHERESDIKTAGEIKKIQLREKAETKKEIKKEKIEIEKEIKKEKAEAEKETRKETDNAKAD
ncbi:MAG: type II and III secretion system protein, partial [Victivallales bacterium]|nr:type II and III secretion system protein [Victivallales bacterium]